MRPYSAAADPATDLVAGSVALQISILDLDLATCSRMGRYGLLYTRRNVYSTKDRVCPRDQNDRASTYVGVLLNDHVLPCNIKVAQAKVSNLSHRQSTVLVDLRTC